MDLAVLYEYEFWQLSLKRKKGGEGDRGNGMPDLGMCCEPDWSFK